MCASRTNTRLPASTARVWCRSARWPSVSPSWTRTSAYYIHCKAGGRSLKALQFLREQGFKHLKSVKGGIAAWSDEIDRTVPKY